MTTLLAASSTAGASESHPIWVWVAFTAFIVAMLVLDLVVHAKSEGTPDSPHVPEFRSSVIWSIFWTVLALAFTLLLIPWMGGARASEYITGYVIERSLSLDNLFVFAILFSFFAVPDRVAAAAVLFYGIVGAIVLRGIFILVGARAARRLPLDDLRVRRVPRVHGRPDGDAQATRRSTRTRTSCCG